MAVEVEATSQVEEFLRVLKKRVWWIVVPFVLVSTLGAAYAVVVPKKYVAMTRVMVRDQVEGDRRSERSGQSQEGKVAKHTIRAPKRLRSVLTDLRWPEWLEKNTVEQNEYLVEIQEALEVDTPTMQPGSTQQLVGIYFSHTDPDRATEFVRLLFEKWKTEVLERGRNTAEKEFETKKTQRNELQKTFDSLSDQITKLRIDYDIPPPRESSRGGLDPGGPTVWDKMAEEEIAEAELTTEIEEAELELKYKRQRYDKMEDKIVDVSNVQALSFQEEIDFNNQEILLLEQKLERGGYKPEHSVYKETTRRVEQLREQVAFFEASRTSGGTTEQTVTNFAKIDLADEIALDTDALGAKKERLSVLQASIQARRAQGRQLQDIVKQILNLEDEMRRTSKSLEDVETDYQGRLAHVAAIRSADANPFEVLDPVVEPTRPTEPNPVMIVLFSIFAGLALGLGLAVLTEYSRNCFRSVHDITRVMVVPVLGTINAIVTRGQVRRQLLGRVVLGGATLGFVLIVGFVTWAWAYDQRLLSAGMVDSIERLREALK